MTDPDTLHMFELTVPRAAADVAAGELGELSPEGFEEHDLPGDPPAVCFVVYGEPARAEALGHAMARLVGVLAAEHPEAVRLERSEIPQQNWREAWKVHFTLQRVLPFVIRPSWIEHHPAPGELVIHLDPGSAFGTGLHETTRLCLRALATLWSSGSAPGAVVEAVLDFGCGTGILGIGACLLWPCQVVAIDDDPLAIAACEENAEGNGLGERIEARADLGPERTFDVVVANVTCPVLADFAEGLSSRLAPEGRLVLSGLLLGDREAICAAYERVGLTPVAETTEGDWLCLVLGRKPAGPS